MYNNIIFIIETLSDLDKVKTTIQEHNNVKIFSLNYLTHSTLERNKISHEIGEAYLTENDNKIIDDYTINTTINWSTHNPMKNLLIFDGINLASLLELEFILYFSTIYRSLITIIRIIEKEKPHLVIAATYLNDFIQRICKTKNIQVIVLERIEQPSLLFDKINIKFNLLSLPISFHISRISFMKIKKFLESAINFIFGFNPNMKSVMKKSILLLDFNPVIYEDLMKELSKLDKNILLLNQRRPAVWNLRSLQIIKNSKCKIINLSQFEKQSNSKVIQELNRLMVDLNKIWSLDTVFEEIFSINSETFWYSIKNSFTAICNSRFRESVRRILLLNELFNKFNISVILEWAETGQEEKEVLYVSKKSGIKSVMLQHSMYPTSKIWEPFARFLAYFSHLSISDMQAVWGQLTKEYAISHGYEEKNLLVTGSPRHDKFFNFKKNVKNDGIILLATTGSSGVAAKYSTTQARVNFDEFLKEVIRVSKMFPDKKLIVKPHPHQESFMRVIDLIKEIDPNIPIVINANLTELISSCDLLITFNNSTIALESLILNKPTISLQTEEWLNDEEIVKMGAILSINNINDIENGIKRLLYDKEFRDKIQDNAKKFVQFFLVNGGHASKTLTRILDKF